MKNKPPITSHEEANYVRNSLIAQTAHTLKITWSQAGKRVDALLESGILNNGNPLDPRKQKEIDEFMLIER